jgi:small GTP-binding protein
MTNPQKKQLIKAVILGKVAVGKTSIVEAFAKKEWNPNHLPTQGGQYKQFDQENVQIQLWDTAGDEKFSNLIPMFIRNATVALLTFEITSKESMSELNLYIKMLQNFAYENCVYYFIGNKKDLVNERKVSYQEGLDLNDSFGGHGYYETSANTGEGIEELLNIICNDNSIPSVPDLIKLPPEPVKSDSSSSCC